MAVHFRTEVNFCMLLTVGLSPCCKDLKTCCSCNLHRINITGLSSRVTSQASFAGLGDVDRDGCNARWRGDVGSDLGSHTPLYVYKILLSIYIYYLFIQYSFLCIWHPFARRVYPCCLTCSTHCVTRVCQLVFFLLHLLLCVWVGWGGGRKVYVWVWILIRRNYSPPDVCACEPWCVCRCFVKLFDGKRRWISKFICKIPAYCWLLVSHELWDLDQGQLCFNF